MDNPLEHQDSSDQSIDSLSEEKSLERRQKLKNTAMTQMPFEMLSNVAYEAKELGFGEAFTERIYRCNTLIQMGKLLDAARLVIDSHKNNNISRFKETDDRERYVGENALTEVIGHYVAYGKAGERTGDIGKVRDIFREIREQYAWDASGQEVYEVCKKIINDLEQIDLHEDGEKLYMEICDEIGVSRKDVIEKRIRYHIGKKFSVISSEGKKSVGNAYGSWESKSFSSFDDFIRESRVLVDSFPGNTSQAEDLTWNDDYNLRKTLYREDIVQAVS